MLSSGVDINVFCSVWTAMIGSDLEAKPSHQRCPKPNPIWAGLGRLGCSARLDARLILGVLARGRPPANIVHPAGVHVAWPTPHGHRRVLKPVRSCSPGHVFVAASISQQNVVFFVASSPFFHFHDCFCQNPTSVSNVDSNVSAPCLWTVMLGSVLARERPPANIVHPAGVPGAWPTPHGHCRVRQPGRSHLPGATLWPHRITVHVLHLRSFGFK